MDGWRDGTRDGRDSPADGLSTSSSASPLTSSTDTQSRMFSGLISVWMMPQSVCR